ncbi:putative baseplate assembly protein [Sorangium sp. So ce281]|uniref:putative baseplate assembly protein n=1 Tax=unclassified Sorangium TaxID=2621164 RepID=UPI003F63FA79
MPFALKNLDDRSYEDLFAELRRRIPAYLPEWTDHNESDPGITLLQLFAWLMETAIFRLNQAPDERMYAAFLNLVGVGPAPARSAEAIVALAMRPGAAPVERAAHEVAFVAEGAADGDEDVRFEAEADVSLIGAALGAVLVDDGMSPSRADATEANRRGDAPYAPFGEAEGAGRALYLGLDAAAPGRAPEITGRFDKAELRLFVRVEEEAGSLLGTTAPGPATSAQPGGARLDLLEGGVVWEGRVGPGSWERLEVAGDETRGLRRSGLVRVALTRRLQPGVEVGDLEGRARIWIRAVPAAPGAPAPLRIRWLAINALRVRQWRTIVRELLQPGSDGTPNQVRFVRSPPILLDPERPPEVEVEEPTGEGGEGGGERAFRPWHLVDNLATRRPDGGGDVAPEGHPLRVFRVHEDRTGIAFGDGIDGLIPPHGPNNLRITYRSGGGAVGNGARLRLAPGVDLPGLAAREPEQREPASGGADEEPADEARARAPARLHALERAVTPADFETLAVDRAGVARAVALSRRHPLDPRAPVTGALTLVVVPPRAGDDPAPAPTQDFLDRVAAALEPYRVVTTELFVVGPRYRRVDVTVEIEVAREADAAPAREAVAARLRGYLDPITGGYEGTGWPLGAPIAQGELREIIHGAPGVASIRCLSVALDGVQLPPCEDFPLGSPLAMATSGEHVVHVRAPERRR